jgi:hypothetical protein
MTRYLGLCGLISASRHSTQKMNKLGLVQEAILEEVQQIVCSSIEAIWV